MEIQSRKQSKRSAKRQQASLYVDEDFDGDNTLAQESLSAFGLKLIDSRKSFVQQQNSIPTSIKPVSTIPDHAKFPNPEIRHRKKRRRKSSHGITLADLNSVVNIDALLKRNEDNSVDHGTPSSETNSRPQELLPIVQVENVDNSDPPPEIVASFNAEDPEPTQVLHTTDHHVEQTPESSSTSETPANATITTRELGAPLNGSDPQVSARGYRFKKGFFNFPLPSRIPKRPRPELFNKSSKPPRPSALRQIQAINPNIDVDRPRLSTDAVAKPAPTSFNFAQSELLIQENTRKVSTGHICSVESSLSDLRLDRHLQVAERNMDSDLPRSPDCAIKLLSGLSSSKRCAFLQHIFYFFNHNHLAILIRLHNGQFLKYLEKWITDAIDISDTVLLRTLLLLLEVLPVTPSYHCKGLVKILKKTKMNDRVILNLYCRVNEKWQFLEQMIRSHKASRERPSKRSISFCDETETLEYSIYLPPDTVRKSKKEVAKGALKQALQVSAVKDSLPRGHFGKRKGKETPIPENPRMKDSALVLRHAGISESSQNPETISSSDLTSLRQSLDAEIFSRKSNAPLGRKDEIKMVTESIFETDTSDSGPNISSDACKPETVGSTESYGDTVPCKLEPQAGEDDSTSQAPEISGGELPAQSQTDGVDVKLTNGAVKFDDHTALYASSAANSSIAESPSTQLCNEIPEKVSSLSALNSDSMDALLMLVPSIVKDFSSSLRSPQSPRSAAVIPNPFLSSFKTSQKQMSIDEVSITCTDNAARYR